MKKFISILLAVIIAFSAVAVGASAFTLGENDAAWIGLDAEAVYTDPGKETKIAISYAANLGADDYKDIDLANAFIAIPFGIETNADSPIVKVEAAEGFKFEQNSLKESAVDGKVIVPCSALKDINSIVIAYITVKMSDDWKVDKEKYKAENPVNVKVNAAYTSTGAKFFDKDGNDLGKSIVARPAGFTIEATKYKPNFIQRAIEWIKQKLTMIPVLFQTLNSYLLNDPLKAPKWVAGIEEREAYDKEQAEIDAARDAEILAEDAEMQLEYVA